MRSLRPAVPILLALLLLPATAALAGPSKEFTSEGFTWSLPDGWVFSPVSPADKQNGVVAKAECENASIHAFIFMQQSDLGVDGRVKDVQDAGGEGMGTVVRQTVKPTTLSGVKGKVVIKKIKPDGGGEGHLRTYVIHTGGTFYQLIVQAWHGSHVSQTEGLNGIRKGFRLAKGAGGEDADETFDEVDSGSEGEGEGDGGGGDADAAGGSDSSTDGGRDWPKNGPTREGNCVKLHNRNVEWTLPEDGPLQWVGAAEDAKQESGRFMWAAARVPREKKEFEKDTPDFNFLMMDMLIQPVPAGLKAADWVQQGGLQNNVVKNFRFLKEPMASKTVLRDETKIGNHTGPWGKFEGTEDGQHRVVMVFTTVLRGEWYLIRAVGTGHTDAYKHLAPVVGKALRGIKFITTQEDQRGPLLIQSVPDFASERGEHKGEEREYTLPGIQFEKPAWMAKIPAGGSMERELRWAGEGRTEDGKEYMYFDISTWQLNIPNTPRKQPEEVIENRIEEWKAGAGPEALLSKKGKPPFYKRGNFGRGKGLYYKFTGHLQETPFTEEGWVVEWKQHLLRFRVQYSGGPDALKKNKELKAMFKDIRKGVDFKK